MKERSIFISVYSSIYIFVVSIDRIFVFSQNSYIKILIPNVVALEWALRPQRQSLWEVLWGSRALKRGISVFIKENPALPFPLPLCEDTVIREVYEPEGRLSQDPEFSGSLILDYPTSRIVRNKFVYELPNSWYFGYSSQDRPRRLSNLI